ncbi:alkaline shock response membrane anchor protein AmaP [Candidatus Omnitrophota bacterium]
MKIFNIIAIFLYTLLFSMVGAVLMALSLYPSSLESAIKMINSLSETDNIRMGMALTGLALIFVNISIAQLSIRRLRRHKTVAFENPYGQVTLSLSAIEDYIKKLTHTMTELNEFKANISAGKSGIEVAAKAELYSDVNIPEVTEKVQNAIRIRLQEILGIEEKVAIKIHVTKIIQRERGVEQKYTKKETRQGGFKGEIEYGKQ